MFFKFFLLLFVSANSYAIQGPLVEIANSYNEEYFWGHELGEAPILFQLDTVLQFDSKVALLQDNLKKLDQVDESLKSTQLYLDLKNFTEQTLFIMRTCQPGVWDYAEAYQLSHFFSKIPYYIEHSNKLADTSVLEQSLNVLEKMLDIYNQKIDISIQRKLFPSTESHFFWADTAEKWGVSLQQFEELLDQYQSTLCPNCNVDRAHYISEYNSRIQPRLNTFLDKIKKVKELSAPDYVSFLPASIKKECYTQVIHAVGSQKYTPQEMLALGLSELQRVEKTMLSILGKQINFPSTASEEEKLKVLREFIFNLNKQVASDATSYMQEIKKVLDRSYQLLPKVATFWVSEPQIIDVVSEGILNTGVIYSPGEGAIIIDSANKYASYNLPSLVAHEGVPGHHLQTATSASLQNQFPMLNWGDFVEGWAFYIEEFMDEVGFYQNDSERLGYLDEIRIRALRLIIPYHFFFDGWTLEQAEAYMRNHMAGPEFRLQSELDRNRGWEGQVLNYMIGKESILIMRRKAEAQLGDKFSVVAFHDFLLSHGNSQMKTMDALLEEWIQAQQSY